MSAEAARSACFVVMPMTVPPYWLASRYGGREDHFTEVYRSLVAPAVTQAGLSPTPPRRDGTENIQAGIINDLQSSALVLADLSTLNPNVFLELGIRSALDKPVCLVWDGYDRLPFDTGTLSTHQYDPMPGYSLNDEIQRMAAHIAVTLEHSDGRNELWKYFGLASRSSLPTAAINPGDATMDAKLDRLLKLVGQWARSSGHPGLEAGIGALTLEGLTSEAARELADAMPSVFDEHGVLLLWQTLLPGPEGTTTLWMVVDDVPASFDLGTLFQVVKARGFDRKGLSVGMHAARDPTDWMQEGHTGRSSPGSPTRDPRRRPSGAPSAPHPAEPN